MRSFAFFLDLAVPHFVSEIQWIDWLFQILFFCWNIHKHHNFAVAFKLFLQSPCIPILRFARVVFLDFICLFVMFSCFVGESSMPTETCWLMYFLLVSMIKFQHHCIFNFQLNRPIPSYSFFNSFIPDVQTLFESKKLSGIWMIDCSCLWSK